MMLIAKTFLTFLVLAGLASSCASLDISAVPAEKINWSEYLDC
jgi:hypothetical protein